MSQFPSYQWYPGDALSSSRIQRMSLEEECCYRRLLDFQWEDGFIPADISELARMCKNISPRKMAVIWERIRECFVPLPDDPDRLINPRLHKIKQERIAYGYAQAERAQMRWHKSGNANADASASVRHPSGNALQSSSSSSEEKKDSPSENPKKVFGQFQNVRLTDEEFGKLEAKFGVLGTSERIESLSEYVASKGKRYKSHYATLLTWERKNGNATATAVHKHTPLCREYGMCPEATKAAAEEAERLFMKQQAGGP